MKWWIGLGAGRRGDQYRERGDERGARSHFGRTDTSKRSLAPPFGATTSCGNSVT
jgi:hypothetical protein